MKTLIGAIVLGLAVGGVYVLNNFARTSDGRSLLDVAGEPEVLVDVATPERRDMTRTVQAPGEVEAFSEVDVSSEVMGKILEMPVEEGDSVSAGDLLCRLDDADYLARVLSGEANVAKLRALITQAEANLERAERDWAQQQRLRETQATSPMEVANYRTELINARAMAEARRQELIEAQALLESARKDLEKTIIRAPIGGVIAQRFAKRGEVVITGTMNNPGTRIMVISDLSRMQIRCRVDEADAPLVKPDQPARIYLQSDTRRGIPGTLLRVGTKGTKPLGRDVVTFETLVLIDTHDERVKPGMSANVEIEVARRDNALTIPIEAVIHHKRRGLPEELIAEYDRRQAAAESDVIQQQAEYIKLVYCIEGDRAFPRLVETGISDATRVEVLSGLSEEDTIVTGPYRSLDQLKDDTKIKLNEKETDGGEAEEPASTTDEDKGEDTAGNDGGKGGGNDQDEAPTSDEEDEGEGEGDNEDEAPTGDDDNDQH